MRNSGDTDASLITPNKKSSGDRPALDVAAAKAAFTRAVFLLGVPGWRPPRLSPGLDPLGIAIFAAARGQSGHWSRNSWGYFASQHESERKVPKVSPVDCGYSKTK